MAKAQTRKWYQDATIIVAIIGGVFMLAKEMISKNGDGPATSPPPVSVTVNTQNNNDSSIKRGTSVPPLGTSVKKRSLAIKGSSLNQAIITEIEQKSGLKYSSQTPDFNIEIKDTGEIKNLNNGLVQYSGGRMEVFVNGVLCVMHFSCNLDATPSFGNELSWVKEKIAEYKSACIEQNKETFIKDIIKYLQ